MLLLALEVEFGPHDADWWMVGLTAASVIVSGALGFFAFWNGRKAGQIAEEASARDERYRQEERQRRADESRHAAAAAMIGSFWSLEAAISAVCHDPNSSEAIRARERSNTDKSAAATEVELLHPDEYPVELLEWFELSWRRMKSLEGNDQYRNVYRGEAIGSVRRWKNRIVTVKEFLNPNRPI